MADHPLTITLSETTYQRIRDVARVTAQPLEQVAALRVEQSFLDPELDYLPGDEQVELSAFRLLSNDTLRGIVSEQLPNTVQERMIILGQGHSLGTNSADEYSEYAALVERGERLMLRKAWAAGVLMDRGFVVSQTDFVGRAD